MGLSSSTARSIGGNGFEFLSKNIGRIGHTGEKVSSATFRRGHRRIGMGAGIGGLGLGAYAYERNRSSARNGLQGRSSGGYR